MYALINAATYSHTVNYFRIEFTGSPIERITPNSHEFSLTFAEKLNTNVKKHRQTAITATT